MGAFNEALAALARAEQPREPASPDGLIFRAMSHRQLGQKAEANTVLLGNLSMMLRDPQCLGSFERHCGQQGKRSLFREDEDPIAQQENL